MAKFELKIYDMDTETIEKVYKKNLVPVSLYLKFQKYSEKVINDKIKSDYEFFESLQDLFLEMFAGLTKEEYLNKTDIAEVLIMFRDICAKATEFETAKNA